MISSIGFLVREVEAKRVPTHRNKTLPIQFSWSYGYQGACAREHVTAKRVLVLAWIAIDGRNDMPVVLAESLDTTELGEFDAVHLLVYLGHAFTLFHFPAVDTQGGIR